MQNYYPFNQNQINNPYKVQPNILPPQQVIQVNGKASVESIQIAPNSSVLLLDNTAPIVWLCVSDGVGRVTATPYDIFEHKDESEVAMNDIETRLSNIEKTLSEMRSGKYDKSNVTKPNTKTNDNKPKSN